MGGLPTGPGQRREGGFTVSRLRKMDEKRYYLPRILHRGKLRLREVLGLIHSHPANKQMSHNLKPVLWIKSIACCTLT